MCLGVPTVARSSAKVRGSLSGLRQTVAKLAASLRVVVIRWLFMRARLEAGSGAMLVATAIAGNISLAATEDDWPGAPLIRWVLQVLAHIASALSSFLSRS